MTRCGPGLSRKTVRTLRSGAILLLSSACALSQSTQQISGQQWQQDLAFLTGKVEQMHPLGPHDQRLERFHEAARLVNQRLATASREEAIVGLMAVVASLEDGHTAVPPSALAALGMRVIPMRFYQYGDGVYLQAADRRYQQFVGKKLVAIGETPADEVIRQLSAIVAHDNDATVRDRLPGYLIYPDLLAGLHLLKNTDRVALRFEGDGRVVPVEAETVKAPEGHRLPEFDVAYSMDWVDSAQAQSVPLWLENQHRAYWMKPLPDSKMLYVQYNQCVSDPQLSMFKFAEQVQEAASAPAVERVVLDLRLNSGGEGYWNKFLLLALIRSRIDQRGKLFVIVGRRTFSAASVFAIDLQRLTNGVFVGEPTGGAVENFGNHEPVLLPNSKLVVMVATQYYQNNGPFDHRKWVAPAVTAELTPSAYQSGDDPAIQAIVSYVPAAQRLNAAVVRTDVEKVRAAYDSFKAESVNRYLEMEPVLNEVGYKLLHAGDTARAIPIFQIATEEAPHSANVFDSLGDALAAAGEKKRAVESYKQALKLNPGWEPSSRSLEKLEGKN